MNALDKKNLDEHFLQYSNTFIQRLPRYAVKQIGKNSWRTKNKPLSDIPVKAHLNGQYYVGILGKWYPEFAILDIDEAPKNNAEEIKEKLGLDSQNSMLCSSESENSYHILIKPSFKQKPPTIRLLNNILKPFANENGIEIYPQESRVIRLPFGFGQECVDFEYLHLKDWKEKLYWFNKLNEFELKNFPYQQLAFDIGMERIRPGISTFEEGRFLFENGLAYPSSRHESQWKILYFLWRKNIPLLTAIDMTWQWIRNKNNGCSKDIVTSPGSVKKEIERQATKIYGTYEHSFIYPDSTHNRQSGYITKADIQDIVITCKASLPKTKFLYNLIKYCYPRRYRTFINLHSDDLKEWSVRGYLKYLDELQRSGIIKRYDSYQVDAFSKSIQINWNWKDTSKVILIDRRAPEDFADTIRASYGSEEFRELLIKAGSSKEVAIVTTSRLFNPLTKDNKSGNII